MIAQRSTRRLTKIDEQNSSKFSKSLSKKLSKNLYGKPLMTSRFNIHYHHPIVLLLPFHTWKIAVKLDGRMLTEDQVTAYLQPSANDHEMSNDELIELLQATAEVELQISHDHPHLDTPVISVQTLDISPGRSGYELSFSVKNMTEAYNNLLNEEHAQS